MAVEEALFSSSFQAELLPIVRLRRVEGSGGVVARHAVLGDEGGGVGLGVLVEQAVVTHAEADDHVQVRLRLVQQAGLQDGVAHGRPDGFACLRDTDGRLRLSRHLADHRQRFEAVGLQDAGEDACLADEADAVGDAYLVRPYLSGELHDFLHARPLAVAFVFHFGAGHHDVVVARLVVALQCPLPVFLLQVGGGAEFGIGAVLVLAVLCAAIHARVAGGR